MKGKFNSLRDEVVYQQTLKGTCESIGDDQTYGRVISYVPDFHGVDYIVSVDSIGFVDVDSFPAWTTTEMNRYRRNEGADAWAEVYNEWSAWCDECDADDEMLSLA